MEPLLFGTVHGAREKTVPRSRGRRRWAVGRSQCRGHRAEVGSQQPALAQCCPEQVDVAGRAERREGKACAVYGEMWVAQEIGERDWD